MVLVDVDMKRNDYMAALGWREIRKKEKGVWFAQ
jgi:hypothetical protein